MTAPNSNPLTALRRPVLLCIPRDVFHSPKFSQIYVAYPNKIADGTKHGGKFFARGRGRPDMHNIIPKPKSFLDQLYDLQR
jgi:hypothetical protein